MATIMALNKITCHHHCLSLVIILLTLINVHKTFAYVYIPNSSGHLNCLYFVVVLKTCFKF